MSARNAQARLRSGDTELTCWVDRSVRAGQMITLKDSENPDRLWLVTEVSESAVPPERGWKVGGLT
jgi:hypothetical protein